MMINEMAKFVKERDAKQWAMLERLGGAHSDKYRAIIFQRLESIQIELFELVRNKFP